MTEGHGEPRPPRRPVLNPPPPASENFAALREKLAEDFVAAASPENRNPVAPMRNIPVPTLLVPKPHKQENQHE